jgi:hypothetical protein
METGAKLSENGVSDETGQMEFDEMWYLIGTKKEPFGSSGQVTVAHGELWPWCSTFEKMRDYIFT